jgi:hypothetical protein
MGWNEKKQAPRSCHVTFTLLMLHTKRYHQKPYIQNEQWKVLHAERVMQCMGLVGVGVVWCFSFLFRNEGGGFLRG